MGCVDFDFYSSVYGGTEVEQTSFPTLFHRASDMIGAMVRWADITKYPPHIQTLYKKAVCAQIDFLNLNGMESVNETGNSGFTVGKVTVHKAEKSESRLSGAISPMATMYLEQTGLLNRSVPCVGW